jgi:hypothetical protein
MLVLMLPSQTIDFWPMLEGHIERSLPPTASTPGADVNQVLYSMMVGKVRCWLLNNDKQETKGFILTTIFRDIIGVDTLLIYMAVMFDATYKLDFQGEFDTLKKYAASQGCSRISSFIANSKLIDALKAQGMNTSFTYVTFDL